MLEKDEIEELEYLWKTNRDKAKESHKSLFWCGCDMTLVGSGNKCKVCGHKEDYKRFKK